MNFSNKTVIITGAANGIGKGIALLYGEKGANVIIADIDETAGLQIASIIKEKSGQALFVRTDVRVEADLTDLMETAFEHTAGLISL